METQIASVRWRIDALVTSVLADHVIGNGAGSRGGIMLALTTALIRSGFSATTRRIDGPISLGRAPEDGELVPAQPYVTTDIAVSHEGNLVAVIESVPSFSWAIPHGRKMPRSTAAAQYTMSSIALSSKGTRFASYAPLERMAYLAQWTRDAATTAKLLQSIRSDAQRDHNPRQLALFLISEKRNSRVGLLEPRMSSLGVRFLTASSIDAV